MANEFQSAKRARCLLDLRQFPWQSYVLPGDGRKAHAVAQQRRALAVQLATYANGNGTNITVGVKRLMEEMGNARRTLLRRFSELKAIGPGFLSKHGLAQESGPAVWWMDVSKLKMPGADVPDSPEQKCQIAQQECQISEADVLDRRAEVPDSTADVPNSRGRIAHRPTDDREPTDLPKSKTEWDGWLSENFTTMGAVDKQTRTKLEALAAKEKQHGFEYLKRALRVFHGRPKGLGGLKAPWHVFLAESEACLAEAKAQCWSSGDWKRANVPEYHAAVEAYVAEQKRADWEFMTKEPPLENGASMTEYITDLEQQA